MANDVEIRVKVDGASAAESEIGKVTKSAGDAGRSMESASSGGGKFSDAIKGVGTAAAGFLAANVIQKGAQEFTSFVSGSIEAARDAAKTDAQLEAVIRSTGGAAGVTAQQVKDMAAGFEQTTNYADDAVEASSNVLLTFTNIGGKVFPNAQKAILDMSTALGTDLQGSTIQVGKALNDPIKGISALSRVGVTFTADQKAMIAQMVKTGDVAGAQTVILNELNKEFGGSAEAAVKADGGLQQAENAYNNLQEKLGAKLIPIMGAFKRAQLEVATVLIDYVLPVVERVAQWLGVKLAPAFQFVSKWAGIIADGLKTMGYSFQEASNFGDGLDPVTNTLGKLGVVASHVVSQIKLFANALRTGMTEDEGSPIESLALKIRGFVTWLVSVAVPAVIAAGKLIGKGFMAALPDIIEVGKKLVSIIGSAVELVAAVIRRTVQIITFIWQHWGADILAVVRPVWNTVVGVVKGALNELQGWMRLITGLVQGDWGKAWDGAKQIFAGWKEAVGAIAKLALAGLKLAVGAGLDVLKALWANKWTLLGDALKLWWAGVKLLVHLWWDLIKAEFGLALDAVKVLWDNKWEIIKGALSLWWAGVKEVFHLGWEAIKGIAGLALDGLKLLWDNKWEIIRAAFKLLLDKLPDLLRTAWGKLGDLISSQGEWARGLMWKAWDAIKGVVSDALNSVVGYVTGLPSRIGSAASGAWDGLINGLAEVVNKGIDYINQLIRAYNGIPGLPDVPTISKLSTNTSKVAASGSPVRPTKSGFATGGITSGAGPVRWGEQGTEWARFPSGTVISSSADTASRAAAGSGGGGGVVVHLHIAGSVLSERELVGMVSQAVTQGRIALKAR